MCLQLTTDEPAAEDHDAEAIKAAHGAIEVIDELASEIRPWDVFSASGLRRRQVQGSSRVTSTPASTD
jgi:hypothetical protein